MNLDRATVATSLSEAVAKAFADGDLPLAARLLEQEVDLRQSLDDRAGLANAIYNQGRVSSELQSHDQAEKYYLRALEILPIQADVHLHCAIRGSLGVVQDALGKFDLALENYEFVIDNPPDPSAWSARARVCDRVGRILLGQRKFSEAVSRFDSAIQLFELSNDLASARNSAVFAASAFEEAGNLCSAIGMLTRALNYSRLGGDSTFTRKITCKLESLRMELL
jgi:tetratricopeptide (TPR) repeat protein